MVMCCFSFGVLHFGSAQGENHGGDLQNVRYVHVGFNTFAHWFGLMFAQSYFSSLVWLVFCKFRKGMKSSMDLLLWAPKVFTFGHGKHVRNILLSTFRPSWEDCAQIVSWFGVLCFGFHCGVFKDSPSGMNIDLAFGQYLDGFGGGVKLYSLWFYV